MRGDAATGLLFWAAVALSSLPCLHSSETEDSSSTSSLSPEPETLLPTVCLILLARNKAHTLPYTLHYLDRLNYPKDRISLYIRSDNNEDDTEDVLKTWLRGVRRDYHSVDAEFAASKGGPFSGSDWTDARFEHLMRLKQGGLEHARRVWADFAWFLDADAFMAHPDSLRALVASGHTVAAPLLTSLGLYANFWAGMTDSYYYARTDDYLPIKERKRRGCHDVPMVHSSFVVDLNRAESTELTFLPEKIDGYDGPRDDIIVFALSAQFSGVPLHVCNDEDATHGYVMLPLEEGDGMDKDLQQLSDLKLQMLADHAHVGHVDALEEYLTELPDKDTLGVDQVYLINLARRPERRVRMDACFDELGVAYEWLPAVDGRAMDERYLSDRGIAMMPDFSEPYHKRALTFGEIGCFLSHHAVWEDVLAKGHDAVVVFEDDIRFQPYFRSKLERLREELDSRDWDLVFLGRKILGGVDEPFVEGSRRLVHVGYTYWTLAYMLSRSGARKLVEERPLGKMVPVDEYLPIMYDRHPNETWARHFLKRDLVAFSAEPLLVHPTHYTGEQGYISDTEATDVIGSGGDAKEAGGRSSDEL